MIESRFAIERMAAERQAELVSELEETMGTQQTMGNARVIALRARTVRLVGVAALALALIVGGLLSPAGEVAADSGRRGERRRRDRLRPVTTGDATSGRKCRAGGGRTVLARPVRIRREQGGMAWRSRLPDASPGTPRWAGRGSGCGPARSTARGGRSRSLARAILGATDPTYVAGTPP